MHPAIAIDGPAASGKSTVAKLIADRLGYTFINTGAMYRAVTWYMLEQGIDPADTAAVLEALSSVPLSFGKDGSRSVVLCGERVLGEELTRPQVNDHVSTIAAIPEVRSLLVERQREYNRREPVVMEGRDIGTVVFPDTPFKYFVTASEEVRASRRAAEGLTDSIAERDQGLLPRHRPAGPGSGRPAGGYVRHDDRPGRPFHYRQHSTKTLRQMNSFYWVFYTLFKSISKAFFSWKVVNREKLIEDGPVLIVSNHQSFLDPPMLGISYEDGIYFFARKTLFRGIFKWALPLCLAIPIDQENPDAASLKHVIRLLKSGKRVLVFPEGSRTPDGEIHDGMGGIGLILSKTKVPVQPLRISGAYEAFPIGARFPKLHPVTVTVGDPIPFTPAELNAKGKEAYQHLTDRIMDAIRALPAE